MCQGYYFIKTFWILRAFLVDQARSRIHGKKKKEKEIPPTVSIKKGFPSFYLKAFMFEIQDKGIAYLMKTKVQGLLELRQ